MKRKDITRALVNEGFTEKTLSYLDDTKIGLLYKKILGEEINAPGSIKLKKNDPESTKKAVELSKMGANVEFNETASPRYSEEYYPIYVPFWALQYLIVGKDKNLNAKTKSELDLFKEKIKEKYGNCDFHISDLDEKIKCNKNDINNEPGFCFIIYIKQQFERDRKTKKKVPLNYEKFDEKNEVKEWVNKIVSENFHNVATKGEIMRVIQKKITEQTAAPEVAPVETPVKTPTKEPTKTPNKKPYKDPWRGPRPQINPKPKMGKIKLPQFLEFRNFSNS